MNIHELIAYPLIPIAILELLLGFLLLRQYPQTSPVNKSVAAIAFFASAFSLNTAMMYLMASRGEDHIPFARMNWIGWVMIPAGLQFIYYLSEEKSRAARIIGYTLYPFWTLMLALSLFTDLIVTRDYVLIPHENRPGPLEIFGRLTGTAMIVWLIIEIFRIKRRLTGIRKIQLNFFFTGTLIFAAAGVVIAGILPVFPGGRLEPGLASYFSLPWVALTFYAMVRYSLFEARILVSRTLTIVLMVLVLSVVQIAMQRAFQAVLGMELSILISLSVIGFLLFGTPLNRKVRSLIDTLVIGDNYSYQERLRESIHDLVSKESTRDIFARFIETIRDTLGVANAGLYLQRTDEGYVMRHGCGTFEAMMNSRALAPIAVQRMIETKRPLIRSELEVMNDDEKMVTLMTYLRGIGADVLIPLFYQGMLRGALALGGRDSGESYGQSDIDLLEATARQAAVAMENAHLLDLARTVRSSLQESEERFHAIARILPTAIFIHQGGQIKYANMAAETLTGYTASELKNMNFWDLIHPNYRSQMREHRPHDQNLPELLPYSELKMIKNNGEERWVVMTASLIEYGERMARIWAFFDITDIKDEEGKLRYQQKLDTASRLAVGLATDFNRVLQGITRAASTVREGLEISDPLQEQMKDILITAERASWLTRSLADFGNRKRSRRVHSDMNTMLSNAEQILQGFLSHGVTFKMKQTRESLPVMADPARIEGALISLVINARDAMPEGGTIAVEAGEVAIDREFIRKHGFGAVGTYAYFTVADTGTGMDEATQKQIFEPFFTTKKDLRAIGFSLAIVYDTVKEHGGYITVESTPGSGSIFTVYLPKAANGAG